MARTDKLDERTVFSDRSPLPAPDPSPLPNKTVREALPVIDPVARPARKEAPKAAPPPPRPRRRGWRIVAFTLVLGWAAAATAGAIYGLLTVQRLRDDDVELRRAQDEKVKALTRRLVGVASHQLLEQDGLTDRLADIIARQVELETRQSTLTGLAERMSETAPTRSLAPPTGGAAPAATPAAPAPSSPQRDRRGALDGAPAGPGPAAMAGRLAQVLEGRTLREQFGLLESSLHRVAGAQTRVLDIFARVARRDVGAVQGAVTEVGLKLDGAETAALGRARVAAPPRRRDADPFDEAVNGIEAAIGERQVWLGVAEAIPFAPPLPGGGLTSNFGTRSDPFTGVATMHAGMDFRSPVGTPIQTTARGRVITAGVSGGYGNLVEIEHGHDLVTRYGHLSAINVAVGQTVTPGTVIGLVGSTGRSTGPHLHYETRIAGSAVDPVRFLKAGLTLAGQPIDIPPTPAEDEASFD